MMTKQISPEKVVNRLQNGEEVFIIDVRETGEVSGGKISGVKNNPLGQITLRKSELEKEKSYVVVCQSGNRSKAACGILGALGFKVEDMIGGMNDWEGKLE